MASTPITDLTFKAILKELCSSEISNMIVFQLKVQNMQKGNTQPAVGNISKSVTPGVKATTGTAAANAGTRFATVTASTGLIPT